MFGLNWRNIAEQAIGTLISSAIVGIVVWSYGLYTNSPLPIPSSLTVLVAFLLLTLLTVGSSRIRGAWSYVGGLLIDNWQLSVSIILIISLAYYVLQLSSSTLLSLGILSLGTLLFVLNRSYFLRRLAGASSITPGKDVPSDNSIGDLLRKDLGEPPIPDTKLVRFSPPFKPGRFSIVRIPESDPSQTYKFPLTPMGITVIYGIPFFLWPVADETQRISGHRVLTAQPSQLNSPSRKAVKAKANRIMKIHFLLSAGHGYREHEGVAFLNKRIGFLELEFASGDNQRIELVLGQNIREWAFGNSVNLVEEIDTEKARPAWLSHDSRYRFDLLSINVDNAPRALARIILTAHFEDDHIGKAISTPAVIISGITCESLV